MTPKYPEISIQNFVGSWWENEPSRDYRRGRLIKAYVPHVNLVPYCLQVSGRKAATDHSSALFEIKPTRINAPRIDKSLPVAALPEGKGESYGVYRQKKRPLVIVSSGGEDVPKALKANKPGWQTAPTVLACPYYGADEGQDRSGYRPELVERIRRCEYPQFVYDMLPLPGSNESILRLDQLQPIGKHHDSIEFTPYCLTKEALEVLDQYLCWLLFDTIDENDYFFEIRQLLLSM